MEIEVSFRLPLWYARKMTSLNCTPLMEVAAAVRWGLQDESESPAKNNFGLGSVGGKWSDRNRRAPEFARRHSELLSKRPRHRAGIAIAAAAGDFGDGHA